MSKIFLHVAEHSFTDTIKMLPFLFAAYLLIEYIEHKKSHKIEAMLTKTGKFGFLIGALLGIVPQCGFSVAAANFYAGRMITMGTLVSVFVATSDEAIPVLLSNPDGFVTMLKLIAVKIVVAIVAGLLTDIVIDKFLHKSNALGHEHIHEDMCEHCCCEKHGILYASLRHAVSTFAFIFVASFILNAIIEFVGEEQLSYLMLGNSVFQPIIAAFVGLIPNCAASVILTELHMSGAISFGSAVSGLCAGAGVGMLVLFRVNRRTKESLCVLGIVTLTGILTGLILQFLGI